MRKPILAFYCILLCSLLVLLGASASHAATISPGLEQILKTLAPNDELPVIIKLTDKVDVKLYKHYDIRLLRAQIVRALKAKANQTQVSLRALLRMVGARKSAQLWLINGLSATVPAWAVTEIAILPGVDSIVYDQTVQAPPITPAAASLPEWNINAIGAPDLWNIGYTGAGVVIASMDTGVDLLHPDLQSKWRGGPNSWYNFYSDPGNSSECFIPNQCTFCELSATVPCDGDGHGTQIMGVMVGGDAGGTAIGVAPDTKWIAVKVFNDAGEASFSSLHQGFQWLLDTGVPHVVNISWGLDNINDCSTEFQLDIEVLKAAEIAVSLAAGNSGPNPSTSISPANNPNAFAVGMLDQFLTIAPFSSRGPSACDSRTYPDVVAPGVSIRTSDLTLGGLFPNSYTIVSGTSFSSPHAAGLMALLLDAFPTLTVSGLETILKNTATDLGDSGPDNVYGNGLINGPEAYKAAFQSIHGNIPDIAVFPFSHNFGKTGVNVPASMGFTVVNRGVANLTIGNIDISGPDSSHFFIQNDTCSESFVPPLSTCTLEVVFQPASTGPKSADLSITSNDPDMPILDAPLTGKGVNPDTIGVYRPGNSTFYLSNNNSTAAIVGNYGNPGDLPIVGDWDGNGTTTIGVYRPSNSTFYLRNTNTAGPANFTINNGNVGDLPIVGDWDGNGTTTIGVYRPSNSTFYLRNSNMAGLANTIINYGNIGDLPIAGDWNGLP